MDHAPPPHGNMFEVGDDYRGLESFGGLHNNSATSMGMGGIMPHGGLMRQNIEQSIGSRDFFGSGMPQVGLARPGHEGVDPRRWDSEYSPVMRHMYARADDRAPSHRQEVQSADMYKQHMQSSPVNHAPNVEGSGKVHDEMQATQATKKRPRAEKVTAMVTDSSSSKRSRAEKHYKEIRLLCEALGPHIADVKCNERAVRMYDKYRDSGKAAGRPSRPMYAAVVLAMSGDEDEQGDESDCKKRLQLVTDACAAVWGSDAPDKRKIWDSLIVMLRIVPLRCPQDNLAGSVLSRLFRCIKFSKERADEEATRELLIKLATTLEQGPLAGKAPKTVAACTMHLYCRHANVGMQAGRMIASSLQVGESTVRTNLRGIYVGAAGGTSQMLLSGDAQEILDACPKPTKFELNLPGDGGKLVGDDSGDVTRAGKAVAAIGIEMSGAGSSGSGGTASRGGCATNSALSAVGGSGRDNLYSKPSRESLYSNPPPLVSTPNMGSTSTCGLVMPSSHLPRAAPQLSNVFYATHMGMHPPPELPGVPLGLPGFVDESESGRGQSVADRSSEGGDGLYRGHVTEGRYTLQQHMFMGSRGGEHTGFESARWSDGY